MRNPEYSVTETRIPITIDGTRVGLTPNQFTLFKILHAAEGELTLKETYISFFRDLKFENPPIFHIVLTTLKSIKKEFKSAGLDPDEIISVRKAGPNKNSPVVGISLLNKDQISFPTP